MNKSSEKPEALTIAEQAARWFYEIRRNPADQSGFGEWLAESPRHVEEYLLVTAVYRRFDGLDPARPIAVDALLAQAPSNVFPLQGTASARPVPRLRSAPARWKMAAAAATVALACATVAALLANAPREYSTDVGEQSAFELPDGSVVYLNTRSRMQVRYSEDRRGIRLLQGEVLFKVAHDRSRPFEVHSDKAVIRAVGTQFNVHRVPSGTKVSVIEGAVQISGDAASVLKAGQEASVAPTGEVTGRTVLDTAKVQAWRQRRLVFQGERLAEVAAEFNRYNRSPQIRIEGVAASDRRLMGIFDADDPESLILFLRRCNDLAVEAHAREYVIRSR